MTVLPSDYVVTRTSERRRGTAWGGPTHAGSEQTGARCRVREQVALRPRPEAPAEPARHEEDGALLQWQRAGFGGTSSAGFRSKNPHGLSENETTSTGMTGQSSGRG